MTNAVKAAADNTVARSEDDDHCFNCCSLE
jgi:hypothetical protein